MNAGARAVSKLAGTGRDGYVAESETTLAEHDQHDRGAPRPPATPQEVWSILRELSESQRETDRRMQETDQLLKRQAQEADQRAKEADQRAKEAGRRFRGLDELFNGQWGKLMEALVEGDLIALLKERGVAVEHTLTNARHRGERSWEFDILAVNGANRQGK